MTYQVIVDVPLRFNPSIYHVEVEQQIEEDENSTVYFHRNCVSRYTSLTNTARHTLDHSVNDPPAKKFRRSQTSFDFFSQCLYCGDKCDLSNTQTGREQPSFVDQPCRSKTRRPTMNTSWRSVSAARMLGRMSYAVRCTRCATERLQGYSWLHI